LEIKEDLGDDKITEKQNNEIVYDKMSEEERKSLEKLIKEGKIEDIR
jgi:parvulin-like peptidyl-prolyl isomerase